MKHGQAGQSVLKNVLESGHGRRRRCVHRRFLALLASLIKLCGVSLSGRSQRHPPVAGAKCHLEERQKTLFAPCRIRLRCFHSTSARLAAQRRLPSFERPPTSLIQVNLSNLDLDKRSRLIRLVLSGACNMKSDLGTRNYWPGQQNDFLGGGKDSFRRSC